ncbi:tyrosine-type recombinase/integrase [Methylovorus menthalis]|uniref:tyrosine-type recombinase/integrase n=1 Tax=Methylovorus menthalis TaxID=1002227 RepID=UPI001E4953AD|nr:integrase arm-type DNA-binding domain-containing protein [Methylovorus menthalis]MCB4811670.1 tyrosine-type recombinase/integrase [Methylovorus menthalis]
MAKSLTEIQCRNATSEGKKIRKLSDGAGLYLWVYDSGEKYWRYRYVIDGKEKSLSLGVYPKVTLQSARKLAVEKGCLLANGKDPSQERKLAKIERKIAADNSFESVAREWYGKYLRTWVDSHAADVMRRLEYNIFPKIGKRPISQITGPELLDVIQDIERRGAFDAAHKTLGMVGQVFRYGIATGRCAYDLAAALRGALTPVNRKHQPAVRPEKFPQLMRDIAKYHQTGGLDTQYGIQLLAHTFLRTGELIGSRWSEVNFEERIWEIPAERMKMNNAHLVPLSDQVIAILNALKPLSRGSDFILPGRNHMVSISNNTILSALYKLGYKGKMTGHGFRSVASTILNETGFNPDVIERQLAHSERNEVRGAYNRAEYIKDRRYMMQWWSDYIDAVTEGRKPEPPVL